jgi:hypothetical protein
MDTLEATGVLPDALEAEVIAHTEQNKFKCQCHGSGYTKDGINFEGPTPRPLERVRITLSNDGQMVVDKALRYRYELRQWSDPHAFVKYTAV